MNKIIKIIGVLFFMFILCTNIVFCNEKNSIQLTNKEKEWLNKNRDRIFTLGVNQNCDIEYFNDEGKKKGYLVDLIKIFKDDLGLNIEIKMKENTNGYIINSENKSTDIYTFMNMEKNKKQNIILTSSIKNDTYAVIAKKESDIKTMNDLYGKTIGFVEGDHVAESLTKEYKHIRYNKRLYNSKESGIIATNDMKIDALIISGDDIMYNYIYRYPQLAYVYKISDISSTVRLATSIEDKILANILTKEINYLKKNEIPKMINKNKVEYNIKTMNLTPKELKWLRSNKNVRIGITKDYLPFDYYNNKEYEGISGKIISEISRKTGIQCINVFGDFNDLYNKLKYGKIDVLNIAKTKDRMKYILYTNPYSTDRDIIVGKKGSKYVRDIFGLEGKKIAIVKGFWHYEYINKNLKNPKIIITNNIKESINLVECGMADYLIENPSVAKYYIEEIHAYDLVEKGITSRDSYLYYGINKDKPELVSIINKSIPLMNIEELSRVGYEQVPHMKNKQSNKKLIIIIITLASMIFTALVYLITTIDNLIKKTTESELLKQREKLFYSDTLTNVYNRNYYNIKVVNNIDLLEYPQTVVVADMNNLKKVNDKYGHNVGDDLLKLFAKILIENSPKESRICRMGGDEFYIILKNADEREAEAVLENIKSDIDKKSITVEGQRKINANAAFGYATRYNVNEKFCELIKIADQRMYEDKKNSKKGIYVV